MQVKSSGFRKIHFNVRSSFVAIAKAKDIFEQLAPIKAWVKYLMECTSDYSINKKREEKIKSELTKQSEVRAKNQYPGEKATQTNVGDHS